MRSEGQDGSSTTTTVPAPRLKPRAPEMPPPPPKPRIVSELVRERERPWEDFISPEEESTPPRPPQSSPDPSLTAFAQLAALRLDCRRAFVSLIDTQFQYVLAEATRTLSLQRDSTYADGDELLVGAIKKPRAHGLCEVALARMLGDGSKLKAEGGSSEPIIIPNLQTDPQFSKHPFCLASPSSRFYAVVPIQSPKGIAIGALCVLDEAEKQGLSSLQKTFLTDLAATIMGHLVGHRAVVSHHRSLRLMQGLKNFVETCTPHGDDANAKLKGPNQVKPRPHERGRPRVIKTHSLPSGVNGSPQPASSRASKRTVIPFHVDQSMPVPEDDASQNQDKDTSPNPERGPRNAQLSRLQSGLINPEISAAFDRASEVLCQTLDVDGVVFFDASAGTLGGYRSNDHKRLNTGSSSSDDKTSGPEEEQTTRRHSIDGISSDRGKPCNILGLATAGNAEAEDRVVSTLPNQREHALQKLLRRYRHGKVFSIGDDDEIFSSSGDDINSATSCDSKGAPRQPRSRTNEVRKLLRVFKNARSIAFVPLWDFRRQRWFAAGVIWSTRPARSAEFAEELDFFRAFGSSIMAEVSRLDTVAMEHQKTTFMSSISHELRSPLHGVLASLEFLRETHLDSYQRNLVDTVDGCGRSLLDTLNHLLDFTAFKRSRSIRRSERRRSSARSGHRSNSNADAPPSISLTDIDLSFVTEQIISVLVANVELERRAQSSIESQSLQERCAPSGFKHRKRVEILLDIAPRSNWSFHTQPGAFTRILMNVVGNSLKYTDEGNIRVSLTTSDEQADSLGNSSCCVTLKVADSGRGISQDFLHNHLFSQFQQEDPTAVGTGLGLSIVREIVTQLRGQIEFETEQGKGTTVTVSFPATLATSKPSPTSDTDNVDQSYRLRERVKANWKGKRAGLIGIHKPDDSVGSERRKLAHGDPFRASLVALLSDWYGMEIVSTDHWDPTIADIFLAEEGNLPGSQLEDLAARCEQDGSPAPLSAAHGAPLIIIGSNARNARYYKTQKLSGATLVEFLGKPAGPNKLADVLDTCTNRGHEAASRNEPVAHVNAATRSQVDGLAQHSSDTNGFPVQTNPNYGTEARKPQYQSQKSPTKPMKEDSRARPLLLLVEDNAVNMRVLQMYAKKMKADYLMAYNGRQAVDLFERAPDKIDIVLMDISMPVMDGMEATRNIRRIERQRLHHQQHKDGHHWPPSTIVALTGLGSQAAQHEALASGVNQFFTKPISLAQLGRIFQDWWDNEAADRLPIDSKERSSRDT